MLGRLLLASVLAFASACGGATAAKKPDASSCRSDGECASGYCECASSCRSGCCKQRPAEPVMCTQDCNDLKCRP